MKATIDAVQSVRSGTEILLTVTVHSMPPRTHIYRISADRFSEDGNLDAGETVDFEELAPLIGDEDARLAYARGVKILASGDNTRRNLLRKLTERGFLRESAERAVERLVKEGYIREDELLERQLAIYAKRLWGPKKFLPNLLEKGFSRADIEAALVRAREEGIYDDDSIRAEILAGLPEGDFAQRRARLYKHGF